MLITFSSSLYFLSLLNLFSLFRLKSLQAQEESRHRNVPNRTSVRRTAELRSVEPRTSEQRRTKDRSSDKRGSDRSDKRGSGSDKSDAEVISDYEKQLRTLKDEIAVLSAEKSVLQGRSDTFSQSFSLKFLLFVIKAWLG